MGKCEIMEKEEIERLLDRMLATRVKSFANIMDMQIKQLEGVLSHMMKINPTMAEHLTDQVLCLNRICQQYKDYFSEYLQ